MDTQGVLTAVDVNHLRKDLGQLLRYLVPIDLMSVLIRPCGIPDFHADPHHGNLLIRPKPRGSTSPYKFEVVLLDHGQYFDIPDDLRVNYARFWLDQEVAVVRVCVKVWNAARPNEHGLGRWTRKGPVL
jgi:hypothetical protein